MSTRRELPELPSGGPIIVGVDGSAPSVLAVRWAVDEGRRRGCPVVAVMAWQPDPAVAGPQPVLALPYKPSESTRQRYAAVLDEAVSAAVAGTREPLPAQETLIGWAPQVLAERAAGASLLVLGSHGRNWLAEKILGSVSGYCVRHAPCPVVVIPALLTEPVKAAEPAAEKSARAAHDRNVVHATVPATPGPLL
jgi:nucleotide-binding universal stress UspA family protein